MTELVSVLGQLIAFPSGHRPDGKDLLEALHLELGDALAALDLIQLLNPTMLDRELVRERRALKLERWADWHDREQRRDWRAISCVQCGAGEVAIADQGPGVPGWVYEEDVGWWCPEHALGRVQTLQREQGGG